VIVNLNLRGFYSDEIEECLEHFGSGVCAESSVSVHSSKVYAGVTAHRSGVYAGKLLLTNVGVSSNVIRVFSNPKSLFFQKGKSSARAIYLKAKEELLQRKTHQFFFQKTPTCAIRSKAKEELFNWSSLFNIVLLRRPVLTLWLRALYQTPSSI